MVTNGITNAEYRASLVFSNWDEFLSNAPLHLEESLKAIFPTFQDFVKELDFVAFQFPLRPNDYTDQDWQSLADWVSDLHSENAEALAFKRCPQSIDPINY